MRAGAAVLALERGRRSFSPGSILPSGRSIALALALLCAGIGAYALARESSLFAIRSIQVRGAHPALAARVRGALRPFVGKSLVALDGSAVRRRLVALPVVAEAAYDRDFPHTLRIRVRPEQPLVVVRRGQEGWLVSTRGRVMKRLHGRAYPRLPRLWVGSSVPLPLGALVSGDPLVALRALHPLRGKPFSRQIRTVRVLSRDVTILLRSGLRLQLGNLRDLRLKLAVGEQIAAEAGVGRRYADLRLPERPVVSDNSQP